MDTTLTAEAPDPAPHGAGPDALHGALLESRQRWRDMVLLGADMAFETDRQGRFTMIEPARVLGHEAAALLGRDASSLMIGAEPGPFSRVSGSRGQRAWLAAADGSARCLSISATALRDSAGGFGGLRGIARDVTEEAARDADAEAATRCMRHLQALLDGGLPSPCALLERTRAMLDAAGAALLGAEDAQAGAAPSPTLLATLRPALDARSTLFTAGLRGEPIAFLPLPLEGAPRGLAVWRGPGAASWEAAERAVLHAVAAHLALAVRLQAAERGLDALGRTDPLTGLLNRHAFLDALNRQLERAALSGGGGALLLADPTGMREINARLGSEAGDAALLALAARLRAEHGGAAMVARMDDAFALWLAGGDRAAAEDRAHALRDWVAQGGARPVAALRIGIATLADEASGAEALRGRAEAARSLSRTEAPVC